MTKEQLRMQMLAGVITEGEYVAIINKQIEEADKASLNESMIGGIVGIGAINQIPSTPKTDYEMAFEHFLGERYQVKPNRERDDIKDINEEDEVEEGAMNEDQTLANINQLKQLATQAIDHYQELSKLSDEFAKINGYDTWREMGRDKGFTSYVNLFDQSVPNSQVNKLNDFISTGLKGDIEKYKADKSLELMRNKKQEKPFIPENQDLEEGKEVEKPNNY